MKKSYLALFILLLLNAPPVLAQTAQQFVHLGNVAGRQDKYKEAVRYYTKAIKLKGDYVNAYYNRGYAYIEIRKYKQAVADLDKAIAMDPYSFSAYHVRGIAHFYQKKYKKAVADYTKAIELDPNNVKFYISRMSAYFKMGDGDGAWKDVNKIQQLGGTVNPAIINLLKDRKYREPQ